MGRHWVVPWMRIPAVVAHQASARTRQSARSTNSSPAKKLCCNAFDPWLVGGGGHPSGVDDEAAGLGVFHEGVVDPRRGVLGRNDDGLHVVGNDDGEDATEIAPGGLEPPDHLFCGL
jgi:hypothetical protein